MPKQTAVRERTPRTIRMSMALGTSLERMATSEQSTFNDLAVALIEEGLLMRGAGLGEDARRVLVAAVALAAPQISSILVKRPKLTGNARLVVIETILKSAIGEATDRMLVPYENTQSAVVIWSIAREIVDELQLAGDAWDYVRSLGSRSPPPTLEQVEALSAAIGKLKKTKKLNPDALTKVETLDVYLGLARDQHLEDWEDLKRHARAERDVALGVIREGSTES